MKLCISNEIDLNMKKVFAINGGQIFGHSAGKFNKTLLELDKEFFADENGFGLQTTDINEPYVLSEEVEKYVWADVIIYHFPVWWFGMPNGLKKYIDEVFTAGHRKGMYYSDGRKAENPEVGYGTGGRLSGKYYMGTTTWNAPESAFLLPGEFFDQTSVDDGVLFGFHKMNAFLSLERINGVHFHDLEKNVTQERIDAYTKKYQKHLKNIFLPQSLITTTR
ncbi:modulator of drug activity B [Algoriphagus aquimarinus]|uniref:Modulator of drug activity B n=2 Tax=Algoriphagus aquimarinus TaxID=237018 RepID=A0A1I1ASK1_9BACT|nr:modulator of drug activity B [Algoriphagus aquimarinus]